MVRFSLDGLFPKHKYFFNAFPRISPDGDIWADQLWVDKAWVLGNVRTISLDRCFESARFHEAIGGHEDQNHRRLQRLWMVVSVPRRLARSYVC